jgi:hypothetical protein
VFLTPAKLRALAGRLERGVLSHDDRVVLAALAIMRDGPVICAAIRDGGLDKFISVSRPVLGFRRHDLTRMYEWICHSTAVAIH